MESIQVLHPIKWHKDEICRRPSRSVKSKNAAAPRLSSGSGKRQSSRWTQRIRSTWRSSPSRRHLQTSPKWTKSKLKRRCLTGMLNWNKGCGLRPEKARDVVHETKAVSKEKLSSTFETVTGWSLPASLKSYVRIKQRPRKQKAIRLNRS